MKDALPLSRQERWLKIIDEWQTSGEQVSNFCRNRKISSTTFYKWRSKFLPNLKKTPKPDNKCTANQLFLPVELANTRLTFPSVCESIDLVFPVGCKLSLRKGFDTELLQQVVVAIGEMKP